MNFFIHIAFFSTPLAAIYPNYIVKSATISYLELLQVVAPPFNKNTHPGYEQELSLSTWKLASM